MIIGTITTTSVATQVWQQATRTLTGLGSALADTSVVLTSIAVLSGFDLLPAAGTGYIAMLSLKTGNTATAAVDISTFDGSVQIKVASSAAAGNSPVGWLGTGNGTVRMQGNNRDAAIAATYMVGGWQIKQ